MNGIKQAWNRGRTRGLNKKRPYTRKNYRDMAIIMALNITGLVIALNAHSRPMRELGLVVVGLMFYRLFLYLRGRLAD